MFKLLCRIWNSIPQGSPPRSVPVADEEILNFRFPPEKGEEIKLKVERKGGSVTNVMFVTEPNWSRGNVAPIGSHELGALRKECAQLVANLGIPPKFATRVAAWVVAGYPAGRYIDPAFRGRGGYEPKKFRPTPPVLVKKPYAEHYVRHPLANYGAVDRIEPPGLGYRQQVAKNQEGKTVAMMITNYASWSGPHDGAWDRQLFIDGLTAGKDLRSVPGHRKWLRQLA